MLISLGLVGLFIAAFIAATLLPMGSEAILAAIVIKQQAWLIPVVVATAGNVLGSLVNYAIGLWGGQQAVLRYAKVSTTQYNQFLNRWQRWSSWSLLLAWVPIIGDPLTLIAGVMRVNPYLFVTLVTLGKAARYLVVAYLALQVS